MRQLALDAGFQQARIVQTDGVPACSRRSMPARRSRSASTSCTTSSITTRPNGRRRRSKRGSVDRPGEGKAIVGRGAVNQKGPETAFLSALRAFKTAGVKLPVNLVLVAEGEEEIGSPHFPQALADPEVAGGAEQGGRRLHPGRRPEQHRLGVARRSAPRA